MRYYAPMSKKTSRSGKRYGGNHTTLVPLAVLVCDVVHKHPSVTKIAPGFINAGLTTVRGRRRVKVTARTGGLLLAVRDNASRQEVHIYTTSPEAVTALLQSKVKQFDCELTIG